MKEPNLLVISNRLENRDLQGNTKRIKFTKWDEDRLRSFSDRHVVLIDFSFDNDNELKKINSVIYQSLRGRLKKTTVEKGLIVIVICGYEDTLILDTEDEEEYNYYSYNSYDFLQNFDEIIKPGLEFNECDVQEKEVKSPFKEYFKFISETSYFTFQYDLPERKHDPNIIIKPISKIKGFGKDTCVAVSIQIKKGFLILLPGYNKAKKKDVFSSLISISRYFHIKQQYGGIEVDPGIPGHIALDYLEALLCREVYAYKAAVTMCRRALQASLLDMGANKKLKLEKQIDELFSKGKITEAIRDEAHKIRSLGNIGAHPDKDELKDVSEQEVEKIFKFMDAYFQCVYITSKMIM
ncbi:DUF4145 domain-containing protein [Patescibacteria group bacterium]|nr:DUF4145 domain-containing protein [Patescibacteria group bacterium]